MYTLWIQIFGISQEIGTKGVWWSLVFFGGGKSYLKLFVTGTESFLSILALRGQIFGKWGRKDRSSGFVPVHRNIGSCLSNVLDIWLCTLSALKQRSISFNLTLQLLLTTLSTTFLYVFSVTLQLKLLNCSCINWQFSVVRIIYLNTMLCLYWGKIQEILYWQWRKISRCDYHDNYTPGCLEAHGCIWSIVISSGVRLFHNNHAALMAHCSSSIHDPYSESCLYWADWISLPPQLSLLLSFYCNSFFAHFHSLKRSIWYKCRIHCL